MCYKHVNTRKEGRMKKVYNVFHGNVKIGRLEINEEGKHRYTPDENGVKSVADDVPLSHELLEASDWREPIPFFQVRLEDAERFGRTDKVTTHRDRIRLEATT